MMVKLFSTSGPLTTVDKQAGEELPWKPKRMTYLLGLTRDKNQHYDNYCYVKTSFILISLYLPYIYAAGTDWISGKPIYFLSHNLSLPISFY